CAQKERPPLRKRPETLWCSLGSPCWPAYPSSCFSSSTVHRRAIPGRSPASRCCTACSGCAANPRRACATAPRPPRVGRTAIRMLDLPGHGVSSRPDAPYTLDWNATQVARFIEHLDLRSLDVVGHSYGGGVAQWLLLKCRSRVRRLALLSSGGLGREVYPWLKVASVPFLIEAFGQRWMGPIAGFAMARATSADARTEIALLTSYLRQPGSARAFSRTVRDV